MIKLIAEKAYYMQEEKWVKDRKGKLIAIKVWMFPSNMV